MNNLDSSPVNNGPRTNAVGKSVSTHNIAGRGAPGSGVYVWQSEINAGMFKSSANISASIARCPPISYILHKKALAFINGKLIVNDRDTGLKLEPQSDFTYHKLLRQPNPLQTDVQFRVQILMTIQAYGYCPVLRVRPSGFNDIERLWIMPPQHVQLKHRGLNHNMSSPSDTWDSVTFHDKPIPKEDVYIFTDVTPYGENLVIPESRLTNQSSVVTNIIKNYEARASIMAHRGAIGILSNQSADGIGTTPMGTEARETLQKDFRKYDITEGAHNFILTDMNYKWVPMTYPIKDLMMIEQEEHDIKSLCDALAYPYPLLSRGSETTFNNSKENKLILYQDIIIPEADNYSQQLNDCLGLAETNFEISYCYAHLQILQQDQLIQARTKSMNVNTTRQMWLMNAITYNEMLLALGKEEVANGNYYYRDSKEYEDSLKVTPTQD